MYIYLTTPKLLEGEDLFLVLFKTINNNAVYQDYCENKYVSVSVTFNEEDLLKGRLHEQHFGMHKYVAVTNQTNASQYWGKVQSQVEKKFMDHSYESKVPTIIRVTIKEKIFLIRG